jgi:hypothetical protein
VRCRGGGRLWCLPVQSNDLDLARTTRRGTSTEDAPAPERVLVARGTTQRGRRPSVGRWRFRGVAARGHRRFTAVGGRRFSLCGRRLALGGRRLTLGRRRGRLLATRRRCLVRRGRCLFAACGGRRLVARGRRRGRLVTIFVLVLLQIYDQQQKTSSARALHLRTRRRPRCRCASCGRRPG